MNTKSATGTQAVDRAALLVATVVGASDPITFAELAEVCHLPKSTASRLLTALERTELVDRQETGSYVAGALFDKYAARHNPWDGLAELARPVLAHLSEETGETVNLAVPRAERVVHIAQVASRFLLGTRDWTTVDVPSHASALGKVLYAYGQLEVPSELLALTDATVTDPVRFRTQLATVRRRGYATTVDELEEGLTGVAVPLRDESGSVIAALGLSAPTSRLAERLAPTSRLLKQQSARLTTLIGKAGAA